MIVTREWIMEHRTKKGAWTKAQITALGLSYPQQTGWIDRISGKYITDIDAKKFAEGKNIRAKEFNKDLTKLTAAETTLRGVQSVISKISTLDRKMFKELLKAVLNEQKKRFNKK